MILINAQNTNEYIPPNSNYNLDNYNYEEAIKYEQRSFLRIIFIFLMANEKVLFRIKTSKNINVSIQYIT